MRLTLLTKLMIAITSGIYPSVVLAQNGSNSPVAPPEGVAAPTATDEPVLELVCHGLGSHNQLGLNAVFAFSGRHSAQAVGVSNTNIQGPDAVRIRVQGENGAIRLPRGLYAGKFHNGTKDGWLKLIQVEKNDTEIRGKIDLFSTSHPQVQIDRDTGDIEIDGNGDFKYAGNCERATSDDTHKF